MANFVWASLGKYPHRFTY